MSLPLVLVPLFLWMVRRLRTFAGMLADESAARQAALERQQELVRIRDEILGVVSHDLCGPLTTIGLSAQLIPGGAPDEQTELALMAGEEDGSSGRRPGPEDHTVQSWRLMTARSR